MAKSTITSLVLDIAGGASVNAAKLALAPLAKFAKSFTAAEGEVGDTIKVPVFENQTADEFAAGTNDYTSAASAGVAGKSIELDSHPWASKRLLPDDDMETAAGKDWARQTTVNSVKAVAKAIVKKVLLTAITATGVTPLTITGSTAKAKVAAMRKSCIAAGINPADATLLLPSDLYTDLLAELPVETIGVNNAIVNGSVEKLFGFGYIAELMDALTYTTGEGTAEDPKKTHTVNAMIAANDAIGYGCRLPKVMNPELFDVSDVTDEEAGIAIRIRATGTNGTDARFLGAEVIDGAQALKPAEILVAETVA